MSTIKVGVCGATGYSGVELLKLLGQHPHVEVKFVSSESKQGQSLVESHPDLMQYSHLMYQSLEEEAIYDSIDLAFLCLPHEPAAIAAERFLKKGIKVIDLSAAYRIKDLQVFEDTYKFKHPHPELIEQAVYGLCEIYEDDIKQAKLIANPGCYTSTALLALIPLYRQGMVSQDSLIIDAKSGYSGAGKKATENSLYVEVNENFYAYGVGNHRHRPEIAQELSYAAGTGIKVTFTPHIIPMDRGILTTIYLEGMSHKQQEVLDTLESFYKPHPFVHILKDQLPRVKWVNHTNNVMIGAQPDHETGRLVLVSVLDNLVKGASGQAMQNMNILYGLDQTAGFMYNGGNK